MAIFRSKSGPFSNSLNKPKTFAGYIAGLSMTAAVLVVSPPQAMADGAGDTGKTETGATVAGSADPLEGLNRITHGFNVFLRDILIDPLVDGYQFVVPQEAQKGISNAASNLTEPLTIIGSALQGDGENAGAATERFLVNTTVGVGGLRDVATEDGIEQRREDLGQAAAKGGISEGAYIVLPLFGPTTARDAAGDVLFGLINPFQPFINAADSVTTYSDNQDAIKSMTDGALDSYAVERNLFLQHRSYQVNNGAQPTEYQDFPSLDEK